MNTQAIQSSLKLCLENKATFPEHIQKISQAGVIKYLVDLNQSIVVYQGREKNEAYETTLPIKFKINAKFKVKDVEAAITSARNGEIDYSNFLHKIADAGIIQYEVDIPAQQTTYIGKNETHIEPFIKS